MMSLRKPTDEVVREFLAMQRALDFTYSAVGATASAPPAGYVVDRVRVKLGAGAEAFSAARRALERWEQFRLGWIEAAPPLAAIRAGELAAVVARIYSVWWLNAARIVYVVDEDTALNQGRQEGQFPPLAPLFEGGGNVARFGFAYGTLPGHAESGEERFLVEWDRGTNEVWYSILAFSRPRHWLARLGGPLVRRMQRRFGRESAAAMVLAVENDLAYRR
jgi:uncharacterized protein (UPF0548 family)